MKIYNKLVRDKIPAIIIANEEKPITRILADDEYKESLKNKLLEETKEVICAKTKKEVTEELADVYEVIKAIAIVNNSSIEEVISVAKIKANEKGEFKNKTLLKYVE